MKLINDEIHTQLNSFVAFVHLYNAINNTKVTTDQATLNDTILRQYDKVVRSMGLKNSGYTKKSTKKQS